MEPNKPKSSTPEEIPDLDLDSDNDMTDPLDDSISGELAKDSPLASSSDSDTFRKRQRMDSTSPRGHKTPSPSPFMVAGRLFKLDLSKIKGETNSN